MVQDTGQRRWRSRSSSALQSDEAILAALDAAPAGFAVFYRRHAGGLLGDLAGRTQNPRLAADICAEAFAAALDGARRFDPARGAAAAWLNELAERELAHAERTGTVRERARRRLGLAPLEPGSEGFAADLEDELVAAARFRAERHAARPALLPRPGARAVGVAAALALALVAAAIVLRGGDGDGLAREAAVDGPAGVPVQLGLDGDGCRRTVAYELLSEVALLRDAPHPGVALPRPARDALGHWPLDAVVEEGARFWGRRGGAVDFWAVPVVPRGAAQCAPATRVCVVAVDLRSRGGAQCMLGRSRPGSDWWLGHLPPGRSVIFGTVADGVAGVRVKSPGATIDVGARGNVFGGVLPFRYPMSEPPRVTQIRG